MLSLVGAGLSDPEDITVKGLRRVQAADTVYLEGYTSKLNTSKEALEAFYERSINVAPREQLEQGHEDILDEATDNDVVILVIGDVFSATTHSMIYVEARKRGVDVDIIHNASILTAVSQTGLQLYKFGKTTSIVRPENGWLPATPYDAIKQNQHHELHTLCLLDIKADNAGIAGEDDFMDAHEAVHILKDLEDEQDDDVITDETEIIVVQDLTGPEQHIWHGTIGTIDQFSGHTPLHSLVIPGDLHDMEETMLRQVSS